MLFAGFAPRTLDTPRGPVHAVVGGDGPPLLLVHGFPQTHLMWHAVAPRLAERFTVVAVDLPGYGASLRPPVSEDHSSHSKRALAADVVAAMAALGHETFAVVGHDRGARVSYRMALDHPERVTRLVVLDVVPTGEIWLRADATFALGYWHWGFLAQPAPLPEQMILGNPDAFWIAAERLGLKRDDPRFPRGDARRLSGTAHRPGDGRGDVRGLPRGRDDRPRARRRRRDDRLPGARALGRRRRVAAVLSRPSRSCGARSRPPSRAARSPTVVTSWRRTSPTRSPASCWSSCT